MAIPGQMAGTLTGDVPGKFWHEMFYRGLIATIAGKSGGGKSLIVTKIVADLTQQGKTVIWCPEEDPLMLSYRLRAAGADLTKVRIHKFIVPRDLAILEETIEHDGTSLVVFDTAVKHIDGPQQRWGKPLDKVDAMCYRTGCAVCFIHHVNKNVKKSADPLSALGGSTDGLAGTSRMVHLVGARPDNPDQIVLYPIKDSYRGSDPVPGLAFEFDVEEYDQSDGTTFEVSYVGVAEKGIKLANPIDLVTSMGGGEKKGPTPEQLTLAAGWLTDLLKDGPVAVSDTHVCVAHPDGTPAGACGNFSVDTSACPDCGGALKIAFGAKSQCEDADLSWLGAVKVARKKLEIEVSRKGNRKGSVPFIRLPDGHPALAPNARTTLA